jgi:predicted transcriptional regulator
LNNFTFLFNWMTEAMTTDESKEKNYRPSTLPFDAADVMDLRVRPADLARMLDVSKQAVSQWIKKGTVSTYPDGTLNPKTAIKEYLTNTEGSRLRANFMKTVSSEVDDIKTTNAGLAARLRETHQALQDALVLLAEHVVWLNRFLEILEEQAADLAGSDREALLVAFQEAFDEAADEATMADPATVLPGTDETLAGWYSPPPPADA